MSLLRLLVVGIALLALPILIVIFQVEVCTAKATFCLGVRDNKFIDSVFPYVMLTGGLIVGLGMKRLSDIYREVDEPGPEVLE